MYTAILSDGTRVTGDQVPWSELPPGACIVSLAAQVMDDRGRALADDIYAGFDAYGFQMYDIASPAGTLARGMQLLCVTDGSYLEVDINLSTGQRRCAWRPMSAMTYSRALLRQGAVRRA